MKDEIQWHEVPVTMREIPTRGRVVAVDVDEQGRPVITIQRDSPHQARELETPKSPRSLADPTYDKERIREVPEWDIAFVLSEILNDRAPIGWSRYVDYAKCLLATFDIKRKT